MTPNNKKQPDKSRINEFIEKLKEVNPDIFEDILKYFHEFMLSKSEYTLPESYKKFMEKRNKKFREKLK